MKSVRKYPFALSVGAAIACLVSLATPGNTQTLNDTIQRLLVTRACQSCSLPGADLRDRDLSFVLLINANLVAANLQGATLQGADLSYANLTQADLRGADLRGAYLRSATLIEANLAGANLEGATLDAANFYKANLSGATMPDGSVRP